MSYISNYLLIHHLSNTLTTVFTYYCSLLSCCIALFIASGICLQPDSLHFELAGKNSCSAGDFVTYSGIWWLDVKLDLLNPTACVCVACMGILIGRFVCLQNWASCSTQIYVAHTYTHAYKHTYIHTHTHIDTIICWQCNMHTEDCLGLLICYQYPLLLSCCVCVCLSFVKFPCRFWLRC